MDKANAIAALARNGLKRATYVRTETYVYRDNDGLTCFTLNGERFHAEGEVAHLPKMMGYSEDEIRKAVLEMTCDRTLTECIVDMLKMNRKESVS